MTTNEQRITSLEQFQRETLEAVQVSNMYLTSQMGIVHAQEADIQHVLASIEQAMDLLQQQSALLMQHNETLIQHSAALLQHSEAIRELLARLPAKE
jgi:hypothetical protein